MRAEGTELEQNLAAKGKLEDADEFLRGLRVEEAEAGFLKESNIQFWNC